TSFAGVAESEVVSPAVVITCALVRISPSRETTKPEPWPARASGDFESSKYEKIVTTPAPREWKICAGWKPLPASGLAAPTGVALPLSPSDWRTTTVFSLGLPIQPPALPTTSTQTAPRTAATSEVRATAPGRTGVPHCSRDRPVFP